MHISGNDRTILTEALSDLLAYIQENAQHLSNTPVEVLNANTLAISSAKIKLNKIEKDPDQSFSLMELKVMYWAVWELREDTRDFVDSMARSSTDRNDALDVEKSCNHLLRTFRNLYKQAGMDPPEGFPRY